MGDYVKRIALLLAVMLISACSNLATTSTAPPPSPAATTAPIRIDQTSTPRIIPAVTDGPFPTMTPACDDAPSTRIILQSRGIVSDDDQSLLNVRPDPTTAIDRIGTLDVYSVFVVLDGPVCREGFVWYRIRSAELEGWVAEGDEDVYYIAPYLPG